jgi:hypothetical protein
LAAPLEAANGGGPLIFGPFKELLLLLCFFLGTLGVAFFLEVALGVAFFLGGFFLGTGFVFAKTEL